MSEVSLLHDAAIKGQSSEMPQEGVKGKVNGRFTLLGVLAVFGAGLVVVGVT